MEKKKIAIVTDSNSGITQQLAGELGITVLPMPFYINEQLFLEGITLTQEDFYQRLAQDADISTSQPFLRMYWRLGSGCWKTTMKLCTFPCPAV